MERRGCGGFRWRVADGGEPLLWCGAPLQLRLGSELPRLRILSHWRGFWGAVLPVLSFGRGYGGLAACRLAGVGVGLCAIEGDRKRVGEGKSVSVSVDSGGRR